MIRLRVVYILLSQLLFFLPVTAQADFGASTTEGCTPLQVKFAIDESTVDMDTVSRIDWHFGRGDSITALDPDTVLFEREGEYTIVMVINRHRESAVVKDGFIAVHRTLSAAFQYEEYAPNNNFRFIPLDEITDSTATYFYLWEYEKIDGSDTRDTEYIVDINTQPNAIDSVTLDTGTYVISLNVQDTWGCSSDYSQRLVIAQEIQVPNIFNPEQEEFLIIDSQNLNTVLRFQVFNRYGLLVFTQTAPTISWNGKTNRGTPLNSGVYFYVLESVEGDPGGKFSQQGFIHLYLYR